MITEDKPYGVWVSKCTPYDGTNVIQTFYHKKGDPKVTMLLRVSALEDKECKKPLILSIAERKITTRDKGFYETKLIKLSAIVLSEELKEECNQAFCWESDDWQIGHPQEIDNRLADMSIFNQVFEVKTPKLGSTQTLKYRMQDSNTMLVAGEKSITVYKRASSPTVAYR